jgi:hypothetical protein
LKTPPKIIKAKSNPDRMIEITFADGVYGKFNFENYFDYLGYYQFLNDDSQEVEIDSAILYAICENKPIIVNDKIVFDPSLGKQAWQ